MKSKYDWSGVPKEIKWIATDIDGKVYGFYTEPTLDHWTDIWFAYDYKYANIDDVERFDDWQNSLEERPK